jgi:hypothetical protein
MDLKALGIVLLVILDAVAVAGVLYSDRSPFKKAVWVVLVVAFPFVGAFCYFLLGRDRARTGRVRISRNAPT